MIKNRQVSVVTETAVITRNDDLKEGVRLAVENNRQTISIVHDISDDLEDRENIPANEHAVIDLAFLADIPNLEGLSINSDRIEQIINFEVLYELKFLKELQFSWTNDWSKKVQNETLDLSKLKSLTYFESDYNKHIINIHHCSQLEFLGLWNYKATDLDDLSTLPHLEMLRLPLSGMKTLDFNGAFSQLKVFWLTHDKTITSIDAMGKCPVLERIYIEKCTKLKDINLASDSLLILELDKVSNLKFLNQLPNLKELKFNNLLDGDMSPLFQRKWENVHFYPDKRPHYSHSIKEVRALIKQ